KKYGGFIPGIRAGRPTQEYLSYVLSRITAPGSIYLGIVALIPLIALVLVNANQNFPFGGTSLLIMVCVGLDTVKQIESQLQQRVPYVLPRITAPGSRSLRIVALTPSIALVLVNANQNFPFGGTSLLIMVGVGLDTVKQIESQLQQRNYAGFLR